MSSSGVVAGGGSSTCSRGKVEASVARSGAVGGVALALPVVVVSTASPSTAAVVNSDETSGESGRDRIQTLKSATTRPTTPATTQGTGPALLTLLRSVVTVFIRVPSRTVVGASASSTSPGLSRFESQMRPRLRGSLSAVNRSTADKMVARSFIVSPEIFSSHSLSS